MLEKIAVFFDVFCGFVLLVGMIILIPFAVSVVGAVAPVLVQALR